MTQPVRLRLLPEEVAAKPNIHRGLDVGTTRETTRLASEGVSLAVVGRGMPAARAAFAGAAGIDRDHRHALFLGLG